MATTIVARLHAAGFKIGPAADAGCRDCTHIWGNHLIVASATGDPLDGGHVECPFLDCACRATWGLTPDQREAAKRVRDGGPS